MKYDFSEDFYDEDTEDDNESSVVLSKVDFHYDEEEDVFHIVKEDPKNPDKDIWIGFVNGDIGLRNLLSIEVEYNRWEAGVYEYRNRAMLH